MRRTFASLLTLLLLTAPLGLAASAAPKPAAASPADTAGDPLATLRPGHPRLLLTEPALTAALAAARSDPLRAALHARILALAEA